MSLEYVALSFFKEKKINYFYNKPIIIFPCPYCSSEAQMTSSTTLWCCIICGEAGNLTVLIKNTKESNRIVYHPLNERKAICQQIHRLSKKCGEEPNSLIERVEKLIEYYRNRSQSQG